MTANTDATARPGATPTTSIHVPNDLVPVVEQLIADRAAGRIADYATPAGRERPIATIGLLAVFLTVAGFIHICCAVLIPRLERMFADLGMKLPSVTIVAIQFGNWVNGSGGWIALWLAAVIVPALITRLRDWPTPERARESVMLLLLLAVLLCLLMLGVMAAIVAPFITGTTSISAGPTG